VPTTDWRSELTRARRFARRIDPAEPAAPVPPPDLPPGRVVDLPGRGEIFLRERMGKPGQPPILLLHGWTATADLNWFRAFDAVAGLGHLLAVDHRGHGRGIRSEERFTLEDAADDCAALLRTLDVGPAIAVGYSMGGPIAMLLAERHPDLVAGLVLEATALEWRARASERVTWKFMAAVELFLRLGRPRGAMERMLRDAVHRAPDLEPLLGWLKGELKRADPAALADAGRALGRHDARPWAGRLAMPAAVVVTTKDRLVKPRKQRALAKSLRDVATYEIAGDHDCCLVLPGPFVRMTVTAIEDVAQRAGFTESSTRVAGWGV
jgi:pimeloyl-ACP methyl ester carboxylesterase